MTTPALTPKEVRKWRWDRWTKKPYVRPFLFIGDISLLIIIAFCLLKFVGIFYPQVTQRIEAKISSIAHSSEPWLLTRVALCDQARRRLPTQYAQAICG